MKRIHFYKFDGAGNDFVLLDTRTDNPDLSTERIARICHRRFGIGADGLMTLSNPATPTAATADSLDFRMRYYNSDGREATMCGNGGRCITAFARILGIGNRQTFTFEAPDGIHRSDILLWDDDRRLGIVDLTMLPVSRDSIRRHPEGWYLDTGSPHLVVRVEDLEHYDVVGEGRRLRNLTDRWPLGTNVDFIEDSPDGSIAIRTYERGVEDETLACGTGVTASAIVTGNRRIHALGGDFKVTFQATDTEYTDIHLVGPVSLNFEGDIII